SGFRCLLIKMCCLFDVIVVMVGDEAALPCQLEPPVDAVHMTVEWGRPDLNPRFVYVWHDGQELLVDQNPAYKGRVSLSTDKLKQGDISLKLSTVKISDNGTYRCYVPKQSKEYFVELLVAGLDRTSSGVVLQCESRGWYPEPELLWLDTEGNLLPAGPTETVPGPDGLYTVSGRATVEQRHGSSFTCRVQQSNTNQSRETHIQVAGRRFSKITKTDLCCTSLIYSVLFRNYAGLCYNVLLIICTVTSWSFHVCSCLTAPLWLMTVTCAWSSLLVSDPVFWSTGSKHHCSVRI
uniref:Ig-like domain-containing protein n=1 Tax=Monopterus albus TaxID=43700 RepID=A0A3Q3ITC4_MONAL